MLFTITATATATASGAKSLITETVYAQIPGFIHGVVPIPAANSANADGGWARSEYGFAVAWDGEAKDIPANIAITITGCKLTLSAEAAENTYAAAWAANVTTYGGSLGCVYGKQTF